MAARLFLMAAAASGAWAWSLALPRSSWQSVVQPMASRMSLLGLEAPTFCVQECQLFESAGLPLAQVQLTPVQRLALSDAHKCLDECLVAPSTARDGDLVGCLEERYHKARMWTATRGPIAQWALSRWLEAQVWPMTPHVTTTITLKDALAPLKTRSIYGKAFRVRPGRALKIGWRLAWMWMTGKLKLMPLERRRRLLDAALSDIAVTYDEIVQREITSAARSF